jgi:hypothetical protein
MQPIHGGTMRHRTRRNIRGLRTQFDRLNPIIALIDVLFTLVRIVLLIGEGPLHFAFGHAARI